MINITNKKISYLIAIFSVLTLIYGYSQYQSYNQFKRIEHEVVAEYFANLIKLRNALQDGFNSQADLNLTFAAVHSFRWNRNAMELGRKYHTNFNIPSNLHKFHSIAHGATFSMIEDLDEDNVLSSETKMLIQRTLEILNQIFETTGDNIDVIENKSLRELYQDLAKIDRAIEGRVEDGI